MSDIPEHLAAVLRDRYVLERPVGAGGMATVYLARDLPHKRAFPRLQLALASRPETRPEGIR